MNDEDPQALIEETGLDWEPGGELIRVTIPPRPGDPAFKAQIGEITVNVGEYRNYWRPGVSWRAEIYQVLLGLRRSHGATAVGAVKRLLRGIMTDVATIKQFQAIVDALPCMRTECDPK